MSIPGKQTINVGLPNESANSDSLYTAFNKINQNFNTLFDDASPYSTFAAGNGVSVDANSTSGVVTVENTGVTNIIAGTNISINQANGDVVISASAGNGGGGTVTRVGLESSSTDRIAVTGTSGSNIVSEGTFYVDLASSGVVAGSYNNPTITVDQYGRIISASSNTVAGTVTSLGLTAGTGIQVNGGPITSAGVITVTNTGVTRLSAGSGINLSGSNGNVTISAVTAGGTVTSVGVSSSQLVITGSPVVTSGTIGINLPTNVTFAGNVNANRIVANFGTINGNLTVAGNISPAAPNKVGGIKPGPGVDISLDGELTIDTANLPLSFGNFTADNNVLSIVNVDENMILQTEGNAEIQLVGNIGFYKPDGLPPNIANRYFSATSDGQITMLVPDVDPVLGAVQIIGSTSGNTVSPAVSGVMLHVTGQNGQLSSIYSDAIGNNAAFVGRRYNGTATSPTQVLANQTIARMTAVGYTSSGFQTAGSGTLSFDSLEDFTSTAQGTELKIYTTAIGSNTRSVVATINNANGVVATKIAATGNVSGGNLTTDGLIVTTGNISGGNILTLGNVGIGTTTALARLHIASGNANDQLFIEKTGAAPGKYSISVSSNRFFIQDENIYSGTTRLSIDPNGNVGIGTNLPDSRFVVTANTGEGMTVFNDNGGVGYLNFQDDAGVLQGRISYDHSVEALRFATNQTEKVRIDINGNVGIGNTAPVHKLSVTGNASISGNVEAGNLILSTGNIIYTPRYGTFYSNVDQTNPIANTAMAMTFNNTGSANGVSVVSSSRLTIAKTGVYNIQFSAQLNKTGGGIGIADIWLAKDGTPVDWTNTQVYVTSSTPKVAAWNFVENVTVANTYYEIMWSSADRLVSLDSSAANTNPTRPGIPSVIVSVTPVGA